MSITRSRSPRGGVCADARPGRQGRPRHRRNERDRSGDGTTLPRGRVAGVRDRARRRGGFGGRSTSSRDLGEVDGVGGDVSREPDVEAIVERATTFLGRIDVLINNAGIARKSPFLDTGSDDWDRIIAVNLRGMFLVARAVARLMVADGRGGAIVNMASTNALGGEQDFVAYNASKGGVLQLTRTMAVELGGHGHPGELPLPRLHRHTAQPRPRDANRSSGTTNAARSLSAAAAPLTRSPPHMRSSPRTTPRSSMVQRSSSTAARRRSCEDREVTR